MASALKERIQTDLVQARKERDKLRTLVLSTILSDARNREIDEGGELDDEGMTAVVIKAIKQRKDASQQMRDGGRGDLADKEDAQVEVLSIYLPEGLSEDEVRAMVRDFIDSGMTEMGPLMGRVMGAVKGRFDGKEANRIVREELGG